LSKRGARFTQLIDKVEDFTVKELVIIARLCNLTTEEIFQLVATQLAERKFVDMPLAKKKKEIK